MTTRRERTRAFLLELEEIELQRRDLTAEAAEIYRRAKAAKLDTRALRAVVREGFADPTKLKAFRANVRAYRLCK